MFTTTNPFNSFVKKIKSLKFQKKGSEKSKNFSGLPLGGPVPATPSLTPPPPAYEEKNDLAPRQFSDDYAIPPMEAAPISVSPRSANYGLPPPAYNFQWI